MMGSFQGRYQSILCHCDFLELTYLLLPLFLSFFALLHKLQNNWTAIPVEKIQIYIVTGCVA